MHQGGQWTWKRVFDEVSAPERIDADCSQRVQPMHKGVSPFENLSVGMVSQFPLEYMHLVCLGVSYEKVVVALDTKPYNQEYYSQCTVNGSNFIKIDHVSKHNYVPV